jgi:hypothetical protein
LDAATPVAKSEKPATLSSIRQENSLYEKSDLQDAQDNLNKYEDYARDIITSRLMPNGKKATKKDIEFIRQEYKRLVDTKNEIVNRKNIEQEALPLGS